MSHHVLYRGMVVAIQPVKLQNDKARQGLLRIAAEKECPVCQSEVVNYYVAETEHPQTQGIFYVSCPNCHQYEKGCRIDDKERQQIHRIGFFVVVAQNMIELGEGVTRKLGEEVASLLQTQWAGYLNNFAQNPEDHGIGAIMLDEVQDGNEEEFKKRFPRTYDCLTRRRLKATGQWDNRQNSPIV